MCLLIYCEPEENRLFLAPVLGGGYGALSVPCGTFTRQFPVRKWSGFWCARRHICMCWAWAGSLSCSRGVAAISGWLMEQGWAELPQARGEAEGQGPSAQAGVAVSTLMGQNSPHLWGEVSTDHSESPFCHWKPYPFFLLLRIIFVVQAFCLWPNLWKTLAVQAQVFLATTQLAATDLFKTGSSQAFRTVAKAEVFEFHFLNNLISFYIEW